jgi:hypothetical protein
MNEFLPGKFILQWSATMQLALGSNLITVTASDHSGNGGSATLLIMNSLGPPPIPNNLKAQPGNGQVTLSWSPTPWADSYTLSREVLGSGSASVVASNVTSLSLVDSSLSNGTTYLYGIVAVDAAGPSPSALVVSATPGDPSVLAPSPPTGLSATLGLNYGVTLTWAPSSGAIRYNVFNSYSGIVDTVSVTTYAFQGIPGVPPYQYLIPPSWWVTAVNTGGETGPSNEVTPYPQP